MQIKNLQKKMICQKPLLLKMLNILFQKLTNLFQELIIWYGPLREKTVRLLHLKIKNHLEAILKLNVWKKVKGRLSKVPKIVLVL